MRRLGAIYQFITAADSIPVKAFIVKLSTDKAYCTPIDTVTQDEDSGLSYLPVIVGMGGISPAGRTSGHQAYRRTVLEALPEQQRHHTLLGLASLMGLAQRDDQGNWADSEGKPCSAADIITQHSDYISRHTLIRRTEEPAFGDAGIPANRATTLNLAEPIEFTLRKRDFPETPPAEWEVSEVDSRHVKVRVPAGDFSVLLPDHRKPLVNSAAQLPTGFEPTAFYRSVHHPRALAMTVFGASDCIGQSGLEWQHILDRLSPDQVAVYASNSTGQLDQQGWGGLLKSYVTGSRVTSKQMPLGYGQMPADFLNAYVLGNVGATAGQLGACATFLYNLRLAVEEIRSGRRRVVMVGTADAPVTPEVIEGFRAMSALADDNSLKALDALELLTDSDYQRACRPFAENCGFTIGESAQFVLLMDDHLALELGAEVLGSVPDVYVNADGWKRSISAPGIGNYITLAKSVSLATSILGEEAVRQRSFVHAHGTSTPKNRTTESHVLHQVAGAFGIEQWPVAAIKAYIGHSQGTAAGDQITSALSTFQHHLLPGIANLNKVADDVYAERLTLQRNASECHADVSFINAKGFGGNNATAPLLSPEVTEKLLLNRHGERAISEWKRKREAVREASHAFEERSQSGHFDPRYVFGENVLDGAELEITSTSVTLPGYANSISLKVDNPFGTLG
ncbi:Beta-ketoacyl-acyl-carrier-protein synthase FabY [Carnimonas sp. R-84865]